MVKCQVYSDDNGPRIIYFKIEKQKHGYSHRTFSEGVYYHENLYMEEKDDYHKIVPFEEAMTHVKSPTAQLQLRALFAEHIQP